MQSSLGKTPRKNLLCIIRLLHSIHRVLSDTVEYNLLDFKRIWKNGDNLRHKHSERWLNHVQCFKLISGHDSQIAPLNQPVFIRRNTFLWFFSDTLSSVLVTLLIMCSKCWIRVDGRWQLICIPALTQGSYLHRCWLAETNDHTFISVKS